MKQLPNRTSSCNTLEGKCVCILEPVSINLLIVPQFVKNEQDHKMSDLCNMDLTIITSNFNELG